MRRIPEGGNEPFQIITDSFGNFHTYLRKYIKILARVFSNILHIGADFAFLFGFGDEILKTGERWGIIKCKVTEQRLFLRKSRKSIDIYVG